MVGNRIKLIRQAHALSLQDLADELAADAGLTIHRSALSGYETGRTMPNAAVLAALSQILGVPREFFFMEEWSDFSLDYFCCPPVAAQRQQESDAYVQVRLERHHALDSFLGRRSKWRRPEILELDRGQEDRIELLTSSLREEWHLGIFPVSSVCGLLESIGWYLLMTPNNLNRITLNDTEICGYETSCGMPFILYNGSYFPDELRYKLLKYLGYAYLRGPTPEDTEAMAGHFARALLISHEQVASEVGIRRERFTQRELLLLKQKYGLPRRLVLRRLYELGILNQVSYGNVNVYLRQNLFLQRETIMEHHFSFETPTDYDMKLLQARMENRIPDEYKAIFAQDNLVF